MMQIRYTKLLVLAVVLYFVWMCTGCTSTKSEPYDAQFCTVSTMDKDGHTRCKAWTIGVGFKENRR